MPILETRDARWPDEAACRRSAETLAGRAGVRAACIELHGPLGAGKTTFARHLLHALGVEGRIKSPTYALMEPYRVGDAELWHFDFYRFDDPQEWEDAGFRDVFGQRGLKLVEWPEKARGLLPEADLRIVIEPVDGGPTDPPPDDDPTRGERVVRFEAGTPLGRALLP